MESDATRLNREPLSRRGFLSLLSGEAAQRTLGRVAGLVATFAAKPAAPPPPAHRPAPAVPGMVTLGKTRAVPPEVARRLEYFQTLAAANAPSVPAGATARDARSTES